MGSYRSGSGTVTTKCIAFLCKHEPTTYTCTDEGDKNLVMIISVSIGACVAVATLILLVVIMIVFILKRQLSLKCKCV